MIVRRTQGFIKILMLDILPESKIRIGNVGAVIIVQRTRANVLIRQTLHDVGQLMNYDQFA